MKAQILGILLILLILTAGCTEDQGASLNIKIKDGDSQANSNEAKSGLQNQIENNTQTSKTQQTNPENKLEETGGENTNENNTINENTTNENSKTNTNYNYTENLPTENSLDETEISVKDYLSAVGINATNVTIEGNKVTVNADTRAEETEKETAVYIFAISAAVLGEEITELQAEISKGGEKSSYFVERSKADEFSEGIISAEEFENSIK